MWSQRKRVFQCPVQIPRDVTDAQVRAWFLPHGDVESCAVKRNASAGVCMVSVYTLAFCVPAIPNLFASTLLQVLFVVPLCRFVYAGSDSVCARVYRSLCKLHLASILLSARMCASDLSSLLVA